MREFRDRRDRRRDKRKEDELPVPWQQLQGAIWLLGLAILAWQDWWFPGILILMAVSGLFQAGVQLYLSRQEERKAAEVREQALAQERANWLPAVCPTCGAPINVETVRWTGLNSATCPYCSANLRPAV